MAYLLNHPWLLGLVLAISLAAAIELGRRTAAWAHIHDDTNRKGNTILWPALKVPNRFEIAETDSAGRFCSRSCGIPKSSNPRIGFQRLDRIQPSMPPRTGETLSEALLKFLRKVSWPFDLCLVRIRWLWQVVTR
jgi:hypothetical protein